MRACTSWRLRGIRPAWRGPHTHLVPTHVRHPHRRSQSCHRVRQVRKPAPCQPQHARLLRRAKPLQRARLVLRSCPGSRGAASRPGDQAFRRLSHDDAVGPLKRGPLPARQLPACKTTHLHRRVQADAVRARPHCQRLAQRGHLARCKPPLLTNGLRRFARAAPRALPGRRWEAERCKLHRSRVHM